MNTTTTWIGILTPRATTGICPHCNDIKAITVPQLPELDTNCVTVDYKCQTCNGTWWEQYTLTNVYKRTQG